MEWGLGFFAPLREAADLLARRLVKRHGAVRQMPSFYSGLNKVDILCTGKGGRGWGPHYLFMECACILIVHLFMASKHKHEAALCSIFKKGRRQRQSGGNATTKTTDDVQAEERERV